MNNGFPYDFKIPYNHMENIVFIMVKSCFWESLGALFVTFLYDFHLFCFIKKPQIPNLKQFF
jgi:hypothetical protein